jgi:hypothetical protein
MNEIARFIGEMKKYLDRHGRSFKEINNA